MRLQGLTAKHSFFTPPYLTLATQPFCFKGVVEREKARIRNYGWSIFPTLRCSMTTTPWCASLLMDKCRYGGRRGAEKLPATAMFVAH